ncbi:MAG: hypothetical protein R3F56_26540 [Planctomycetota bacterium]
MSDLRRLCQASVLILAGCGEPGALTEAKDVVRTFEAAVRAGDRATARRIVTLESRPAVDAMPLVPSGKAPLTVIDAVARPDGVHVQVRDPNLDDRAGAFVVVRENGALRVDLVASAGLTAREIPLPGARERTVVRPLSASERARAAQRAAGWAEATAGQR